MPSFAVTSPVRFLHQRKVGITFAPKHKNRHGIEQGCKWDHEGLHIDSYSNEDDIGCRQIFLSSVEVSKKGAGRLCRVERWSCCVGSHCRPFWHLVYWGSCVVSLAQATWQRFKKFQNKPYLCFLVREVTCCPSRNSSLYFGYLGSQALPIPDPFAITRKLLRLFGQKHTIVNGNNRYVWPTFRFSSNEPLRGSTFNWLSLLLKIHKWVKLLILEMSIYSIFS